MFVVSIFTQGSTLPHFEVLWYLEKVSSQFSAFLEHAKMVLFS
jgi:hypothetical protein